MGGSAARALPALYARHGLSPAPWWQRFVQPKRVSCTCVHHHATQTHVRAHDTDEPVEVVSSGGLADAAAEQAQQQAADGAPAGDQQQQPGQQPPQQAGGQGSGQGPRSGDADDDDEPPPPEPFGAPRAMIIAMMPSVQFHLWQTGTALTFSLMHPAQVLCACCRVHPIVFATMRGAREKGGQRKGAEE